MERAGNVAHGLLEPPSRVRKPALDRLCRPVSTAELSRARLRCRKDGVVQLDAPSLVTMQSDVGVRKRIDELLAEPAEVGAAALGGDLVTGKLRTRALVLGQADLPSLPPHRDAVVIAAKLQRTSFTPLFSAL